MARPLRDEGELKVTKAAAPRRNRRRFHDFRRRLELGPGPTSVPVGTEERAQRCVR
jgi:hypothetical protein